MKFVNRLLLLSLVTTVLAPLAVAAQIGPAPVVVDEVRNVPMATRLTLPATVRSRHVFRASAPRAGRLGWIAEPGDVLARGQPAAQMDDLELRLNRNEQAALVERQRLNLRRLSNEYQRMKSLHERGLASEEQLEQARLDRDLARNDLDVARIRVEQLDEQLARGQIVAPFDGVVTERLARAGSEVALGAPLLRLIDHRNLEVAAQLPSQHAAAVQPGAVVGVHGDLGQLEGIVRAVVPVDEGRAAVVELIADLPADGPRLPVGDIVRVDVAVGSEEPRTCVPRDALVLRSDGIFVFRVSSDDKAERLPVRLGLSNKDCIAVDGELRSADSVVVRGAETLRDGQAVSRVPAG